MKNSHIEWTDNTFNPWIGCTKVSPGCVHCYAETRDQRFSQGKHWGKGAPRQRTSAANWKQPIKWNRDAELGRLVTCDKCGWRGDVDAARGICPTPDCLTFVSEMASVRPRVFCASLADWLDDEVSIEWLADLLKLIHDTPSLDWLLLTKRPENWSERIHHAFRVDNTGDLDWLSAWLDGHFNVCPNVWIGTTVEDQQRADERIPKLLEIPARVRFLSCEPLLGHVDLPWQMATRDTPEFGSSINWVICGGESGPGARPMHPDWARGLRDQCQAAGVPFLFKQWGSWKPLGATGNFADTMCGDVRDEKEVRIVSLDGTASPMHVDPPLGSYYMEPAPKKEAGRNLDGREWNEFPKVGVPA